MILQELIVKLNRRRLICRDVQGLFCSDIPGEPFHGSQDWRAACAVYDHYVSPCSIVSCLFGWVISLILNVNSRLEVKRNRGLRRFNREVAVALGIAGLIISMTIVSSRNTLAQGASARAPDTDADRKAECALRLTEFVKELDRTFDTEHSIAPVQDLFQKYFPLSGCDIDQISKICRQSRYFAGADKQMRVFTAAFDNAPYHPYSKLFVQITFDRKSGNSEPPFVVIH